MHQSRSLERRHQDIKDHVPKKMPLYLVNPPWKEVRTFFIQFSVPGVWCEGPHRLLLRRSPTPWNTSAAATLKKMRFTYIPVVLLKMQFKMMGL